MPTAIRGADVSGGNRLRVGMSMVQVASIVGLHQIEKVKKLLVKLRLVDFTSTMRSS